MGFIVSRRIIPATSDNLVSISFDRVGQDALKPRYEGEGVSFKYHRAAQMAALRIVKMWRKDAPHLKIEYGG